MDGGHLGYLHTSFLPDLLTGLPSAPISDSDRGRLSFQIKQASAGDLSVSEVADEYVGALNLQLLRNCVYPCDVRAFGPERLSQDFSAPGTQGVMVDLTHAMFSKERPVLEIRAAKSDLDRILLDCTDLENYLLYIQEFPLQGHIQLVDADTVGYGSGELVFRLTVSSVLTHYLKGAHHERMLEAAFCVGHVPPLELATLYDARARPVSLQTRPTMVHRKPSNPLKDYWHEELHRAVVSSRPRVIQDGGQVMYRQAFEVFESEVHLESLKIGALIQECGDLSRMCASLMLLSLWNEIGERIIFASGFDPQKIELCERFIKNCIDHFPEFAEIGNKNLTWIERRKKGQSF